MTAKKPFVLTRHPNNPILEKDSRLPWMRGSVLNPTVWYEGGIFKMAYRATNDVFQNMPGRYMSSIGYAESTDGIHFTSFSDPIISPDQDYESKLGCEDPRITKIDDTYFMYYTAVGKGNEGKRGLSVRIALATAKNNIGSWKKHGVVGPKTTRSKAAFLFPEKINGKYIMFYTINADQPESSIMVTEFDSYDEVINPPVGKLIEGENKVGYEKNVVIGFTNNSFRGPEVGAVPVKTKKGWLLIFCPENATKGPLWTIGAALLDLENPRKVLAVSREPVLKPEVEAELKGVVNNVTFPEGAVIVGDKLYVYYGSGDQGICLAICKLDDLLGELHN